MYKWIVLQEFMRGIVIPANTMKDLKLAILTNLWMTCNQIIGSMILYGSLADGCWVYSLNHGLTTSNWRSQLAVHTHACPLDSRVSFVSVGKIQVGYILNESHIGQTDKSAGVCRGSWCSLYKNSSWSSSGTCQLSRQRWEC